MPNKNFPPALAATTATLAAVVAARQPDLTAKQLCILFECYSNEELQTVRGLAARFNISKPAVTRALDKLCALNLTTRAVDMDDRRSIFVRRTAIGKCYIERLARAVVPNKADNALLSAVGAMCDATPMTWLGLQARLKAAFQAQNASRAQGV